MKFKKQSIKELLDKGANLIIDDELTVKELQELAQIAATMDKDKDKRHITIIARNKGLEDLKRIVSAGNGCVTIDVSGR